MNSTHLKSPKFSPLSPHFKLDLGSLFLNYSLERLSRQPSRAIVGLGLYFTHLLGITVLSCFTSNSLKTTFSYILYLCLVVSGEGIIPVLATLSYFFVFLKCSLIAHQRNFSVVTLIFLDASHLSSSFTEKYFCKYSF